MKLGGNFHEISKVAAITLASQGSWLLTVSILARHLPRDRFGFFVLWLYALNLLWAGGMLGFQNAILRSWPKEHIQKHRWHELFRPIGYIAGATGILISGSFYLLYGSSTLETLLLFVAGTTIGFSLLPVTLLQIFRKYSLAQFIYTSWRPVLLIATVVMLETHTLSLLHVFLVLALFGIVQLAGGILAVWHFPHGNQPIALQRMIPDAFAFTGLHMAALLALRLDSLTMPKLLDFDALGLYSALAIWAMTGYQLAGMALAQVLNPKLASGESVPIRKLLTIVCVMGALGGVAIIGLSDWVLPWIFGQQYAGSHHLVVTIMVIAGLFQTLYVFPSSRIGILASRRSLYSFAVLSFISIGVGSLLLLILVPRFGLSGAALASAITWAWRTASAWFIAERSTAPRRP